MSLMVTIVIPVLPGQEENLALSLQHLQKLKVCEWARITVVSGHGESTGPSKLNLDWVGVESNHRSPGDLLLKGMQRAQELGTTDLIWLTPGVLPREGTLFRMYEITRCRKAITTPGRVLYPCRRRKSGGFEKSFLTLKPVNVGHGNLAKCDAASELCACIPMEVIQLPENSDRDGYANFRDARDLTLIMTSNGIPCLVDGESEIDVHPTHNPESESWLLGDRSVLEIWSGFSNPACAENLKLRIRYYTRHWGVAGFIPAITPLIKLAAIAVVRFFIPLPALRQLYGRHSSAWQIQQLHKHKLATEQGS